MKIKTEKTILAAFVLNGMFSALEFLGGVMTGSVAIASDALHDAGDAASLGISWFLEKKSKRPPDDRYTLGYGRYSVLCGLITASVLLLGSLVVIGRSVARLWNPVPIHSNGMIGWAMVGILVNFLAAFLTHEGHSLNQKAVNLHLLEDVLGWIAVLVGGVVMHLTDWFFLDPILSIGVAVFIFISAWKQWKEAAQVLLNATPAHLDRAKIKERLECTEGVAAIHHFSLWSIDGRTHAAALHLAVKGDPEAVKEGVRALLQEYGIGIVTLETKKI